MDTKETVIAIVFNSLNIGGIERKIVDLSQHYSQKKGTRLHLFLKLNQGDFLSQIPSNVHVSSMSRRPNFWINILFPLWIWKQLFQYRPHLTLTFGNYSAICTLLASRFFSNTKVVVSEDSSIDQQISLDSYPLIRKALVKYTYQQAHGIIALTPIAKQKIASIAPVKKITILPNWLPISLSPSTPSPTRPIDILFIGRFENQKNPMMFLSLCRKIQKLLPTIKITMVGQGSLLPQIKSYIKKNQLNVELQPATTPAQDLYPKSKVMVLTSVHEGFPLTILESFYFGCPVICRSIKELVPFFKYHPNKFLYNTSQQAIDLIFQAVTKPSVLQKATKQYRDMIITSQDKNFHDTLDYLQQFL